MIKLATVSPCYNEEAVLRHSVERLTKLFAEMTSEGLITEDSMIVLVNDGSRDATWQLIATLHDENPRVVGIDLSHNVGHQNAIMAGMMTVRNWVDAVITIDADLQDDINCIPQMVRLMEAGSDVVYGVKTARQGDAALKRFTAEMFYKMQSAMGVENVFNHADFRLMSRRALEMLSEYPERNLYLRGLIPRLGLPSATVSDTISERYAGTSKYTVKKMAGLAIDGITAFSAKPLYLISYMGVLFLIIALGIAVYVAHALIVGSAVSGWASLLLSVWIVGGFILIAIGIAGTYIAKIYVEVKGRPLYHVKEVLR